MTQQSERQALLETAIVLARSAGEYALAQYHTDYATDTKSDGSLVTSVDTTLSARIIEGLRLTSIPVLSEEGGSDAVHELAQGQVWVVDPLDGTMDYSQRTGDFAIMIGLVECGVPVLGVVYVPVADKLYFALRGEGAFCKEGGTRRRIAVSTISDPFAGRVVGSRNHQNQATTTVVDTLGITHISRVGSNGVKMGLVAEGLADIFVSSTTKMGWWDVCAPQVILEEAGGRCTGVVGERIAYTGPDVCNPHGIVVTNGLLHDEVVAALAVAGIAAQ